MGVARVSMADCNSAAVDHLVTDLRTPPTPHILCSMRDWLILIAHLVVTTIRTMAPGGARAVIAESLLLKHQLPILKRSRKRAPKLRALDRIVLGLGAILLSHQRLVKVAVAIRPSTLLRFHRALVRRKYQWLFSAKTRHRPGPKGPSKELIAAILEIKRLNPRIAALASLNRFRMPSAWTSTRMSCAGLLQITLFQGREAKVLRGSLPSLKPATVCGASIYFAASRSC
ncbi:MAG: hypothetical protein ABI885_11545 [Gammaproteobacteria bacterium]